MANATAEVGAILERRLLSCVCCESGYLLCVSWLRAIIILTHIQNPSHRALPHLK
jgi:hypothetical protein